MGYLVIFVVQSYCKQYISNVLVLSAIWRFGDEGTVYYFVVTQKINFKLTKLVSIYNICIKYKIINYIVICIYLCFFYVSHAFEETEKNNNNKKKKQWVRRVLPATCI